MISSASTSGFSSAIDAARPGRLAGVALAALTALGLWLAPRGGHAQETDYRIQPSDTLIVDVVNEKELTKQLRVSASGEISFPYLGNLQVAGKTPLEVQEQIKTMLAADYLVDPQVLVQVGEFRKKLVSVFGAVNRPGLVEIPFDRPLTVIEAITQAGGFTRLARTSGIQVTRTGMAQPLKLDERDLRKITDATKIFYLEPGDVVYVPEAVF